MRSGPGLEATVDCFAFQLGMRLTEIGPLYDWPNKTVIPRSKMPHPRPSRRQIADRGRSLTGSCNYSRACGKALAAVAVRRNYSVAVKLQ